MKNVIVTGLVMFALVGCSGPSAEDAGAVPLVQDEVVAEEAPAVEVVTEEAPVDTVAETVVE